MKCPRCTYKVRKKAVWGRSITIGFVAVLFAVFCSPVEARGPGSSSGKSGSSSRKSGSSSGPSGSQHARLHPKLDKALNAVADGNGESDVIVEFHDDSDSASRIRNHGGVAGKKLSLLKARAGRVPNSMLKRLADDSKVKRVHHDREATGEMARTAATVGALTARLQYGYSGAGIGVAVIDSGITNWHDDLGASATSKTGQRVTAFVDFVNGRTTKYDDWGHGTHVAGIIAGSGYHSYGARAGIAPKANIVALKALDNEGKGRISYIIAALDWVLANRVQYNIRVVNMSLGAGVYESYNTDPLTRAAKRVVDAGVVVVAAAGNMGKALNGQPQYGAISAPGNAPWVLTVGASTTEGTVDRRDDKMALYSSRGPTMVDFAAKPDLVAPGTGTVSLATQNSLFYLTKVTYLLPSLRSGLLGSLLSMQYLTLSGTSMATPVVSGTVAMMLEANPKLTPNMVKAILQFTSEAKPDYDFLTQGAGFLNTYGAVNLSRYFATAQKGDHYPDMRSWSKHILWGNKRVRGGVLTPGGTAWALNIVWGDSVTPDGQNIVWGENCDNTSCANIVKGNNIVWGESDANDNVVWGNTDGDNVVWGNSFLDNIVWGNNVVWGDSFFDNIVWGNDCGGADCDNVVWGNTFDNVVWGNAEGIDNIVWGNCSLLDNIVWGNSGGDADITWGSSGDDLELFFGDDTTEVDTFNPDLFDALFDVAPIVNPAPTGSGLEGGLQ
jgi:serine protease AprX